MKKQTWILILALVLCFVFSGCTLDSIRKSHGICNEEGIIEWNGQEYIALPSNVTINSKYDYKTRVYITEKDVPDLLQQLYGYNVVASEDGRFLDGWYGGTYCRSDCYEEIAAMVRNPGTLEYFCYYSAYRGETLRISKEDSQWLRSVLEQLEPLENGDPEDNWTEPTQINYAFTEYLAELIACNQDMLLQKFAYNICITEEGYLFERYNEETGGYVQLLFPEQETERLESVFKFKP